MTDADDFFRQWTTDANGNRVRVGLTKDETNEYLELHERQLAWRLEQRGARLTIAESKRYLELHDKHEAVRIQAVVAEAEMRQKPTIN